MSALDELFEKVGEHKDGDKRVVHIFSTFEKFDEAIEELAQLRAKLVAAEKVAEAARKLNNKTKEVYASPEYKDVWVFYHTHFGEYRGARWEEEQTELVYALAELDKVTRGEG